MEQAVSAPVTGEEDDTSVGRISDEKHRRVRFAASMMFLVDGIGFGAWAALLPTFKQKFGLDERTLGLALLGMVIGAMFGMPTVGQTIARWGSRRSIRVIAPIYSLFPLLLTWVPSFPLFIVVAAVFGAFKGAFDVSVNSQAIAVENAGTRPIMSTFQALWSIGGGLASLAVSYALKQGVATLPVAAGISAVLLLVAIVQSGGLLSGDSSKPREEGTKTSRWPSRVLLRIGALAFLVLFAEGVMMDWSAVYTRTVAGAVGAHEWLAPLAFGVFSVAMATGRLVGDRVLARVGPAAVLRYGGLLTVVGMLIVVTLHYWPATYVGLALVGLGLSNQVPVLFGAGGRAHANGVGEGVAAVSTMGYFGFLAGPPAIGGIGHVIGLPAAFSLVVVFAIVLAAWGPRTLGKAAG